MLPGTIGNTIVRALFQDRFKSEPIEDDVYLLSALRYIHQNPVAAGMCRRSEGYEWSSFADYAAGEGGLADTTDVLMIFSSSPKEQTRLFKEFMGKESASAFLDIGEEVCKSDEVLRKKIARICGAASVGAFQMLSSDEKNRVLQGLRNDGLSIRQIVRLTGVPFGIVRKIPKG